jgi:large subunit ribosomal protein L21
MYAVIETGGKQFRVELGTTLEVDRLDAEPGTTLTLDRVLLVADGDTAEIGRPVVANASVSAGRVGAAPGAHVVVLK